MRSYTLAIVAAIVLAVGTTSALGAITMDAYAYIGPSVDSAAFTVFADDVHASLEAGGTSVGSATPVSEISTGDIFTWNSSPETGKAIWYAIVVESDTPNIVLDNLSYGIGSTDSGGSFEINGGPLVGESYLNYTPSLFGYIGGNGGTEVTDSSVPVDFLIGILFGQSAFGDASDLAYLNNEVVFDIQATFFVMTAGGGILASEGIDVDVTEQRDIPEPSALLLISLGSLMLTRRC